MLLSELVQEVLKDVAFEVGGTGRCARRDKAMIFDIRY